MPATFATANIHAWFQPLKSGHFLCSRLILYHSCKYNVRREIEKNSAKMKNESLGVTKGICTKHKMYLILTTYVMYLIPNIFREKSLFCGSITLSPAVLTSKSTRLVGVLFTEDLGIESCCRKEDIGCIIEWLLKWRVIVTNRKLEHTQMLFCYPHHRILTCTSVAVGIC